MSDLNLLIFIIGMALLCFLMTCWAMIDVYQKDFGSMEIKVVWGIISWIPFIGFIIYLVFGYKKGKKLVKGEYELKEKKVDNI